jgi:lipoate synthase
METLRCLNWAACDKERYHARLGETKEETIQTMQDLKNNQVDVITMGNICNHQKTPAGATLCTS